MLRAELLFIKKKKGFLYAQGISANLMTDIRNTTQRFNTKCTVIENGYNKVSINYSMYFR
jgi:hypothetical protein